MHFYTFRQHLNVLNYFVYVQYGLEKWFEVAVNLNHDLMESFQLNM